MIPSRISGYRRSLAIGILRFGAAVSILALSLLIAVLFRPTIRFFGSGTVGIPGFLFGGTWAPEAGAYGARAFFSATFRVSILAVLFAVPGALVLALYMSDYAPEQTGRRLVVVLEVLASIPAVVYGLFALLFVTPALRGIFGVDVVQPYNILSASLMLGLYITPYITTLISGRLSQSRSSIRQAALALGATRSETVLRLVIPDSSPGILSALFLGFARALAESVIVGMAAGLGPSLGIRLFKSAETVTGLILRTGSGGTDAIYAFGAILLLLTVLLNLFGDWIGRRSFVEELR